MLPRKSPEKRREDLANHLATMNRKDLIRHLRAMHCKFALDFTDEFLGGISEERLRHIVLGASLHDHGGR